MLLVRQITLREIQLPLVEPFRISSGVETDRRIALVEVEDADGFVAWGECVAGAFPNYAPECIDAAWIVMRDYVAPRVIGREFKGPEEIQRALDYNFRGNNMAKAAIEMALWDLAAQVQNVPLSKLLGGTREKVPTGISVGLQESPEDLVKKAVVSFEEGYNKVKIKICPGKDIQYVRAVYTAIGPDKEIMVDANNAYTLKDTDHLRKLDEFGLMMIEQPLAWDDVLRHAMLQEELRTPICLDESITNLDRAEDMIKYKAGRIINIKPGRVGGFSASKAIHDLCQEHGIPVWCGGMLESGIGRAHNVALASLPNFVLPGDISPSKRYWKEDIVEPEWTMDKDGFVKVPLDRRGIGVNVRTDRIEKLTVRKEIVKAA
jgi:O-succinylbenzoate synthase